MIRTIYKTFSPLEESEVAMFTKEKTSSLREVLKIAGKVFAENGYDSTTVEMIAGASGHSVDEIRYRYGGKEKLYAEVFDMFITTDRHLRIDAILQEHPHWIETAEGCAKIIRKKIQSMFENLRTEELPWKADLVMREMNAPALVGENQINYVHRQIVGDMEKFLRAIRPELSDADIYYCACIPVTFINFFLFRTPFPAKNGKEFTEPEMLQSLADFVTSLILHFLNLPVATINNTKNLYVCNP